MKIFLLIGILVSSTSYALESTKMGEHTSDSSACAQAIMDECNSCQKKFCGKIVQSDSFNLNSRGSSPKKKNKKASTNTRQ